MDAVFDYLEVTSSDGGRSALFHTIVVHWRRWLLALLRLRLRRTILTRLGLPF